MAAVTWQPIWFLSLKLAVLANIAIMVLAVPVYAASKISMWYRPATNNEFERDLIDTIVTDYNDSQARYRIVIEKSLAQANSRTDNILDGTVPDIFDVTELEIPILVWTKSLVPFNLLPEFEDEYLPGALSRIDDDVYAIALWEMSYAMFARKSILEAHNIRIPTYTDPWSKKEFDNALLKISQTGLFEYPLDLGLNKTNNFYYYAFIPFLRSFGGSLINPRVTNTSSGHLNGRAAITFGIWLQNLVRRGLIPGPEQSEQERLQGFLDGRYALQWNISYFALDAITQFGDDFIMLPMPDFGNGSKTSTVSWKLAISANSRYQEGAQEFLKYASQEIHLATFAEHTGMIPPTNGAAKLSDLYGRRGPLMDFYDYLLNDKNIVRPLNPAQSFASPRFIEALVKISKGANVANAFNEAARQVNQTIRLFKTSKEDI